MRRIPPLPAVRVFEAAARHENFTLAAAELGMTQAAVSYQIKLLEERLGAPLFLRRPRALALSEAGQWLSPRVFGLAARLSGEGLLLAVALVFCFGFSYLAALAGLLNSFRMMKLKDPPKSSAAETVLG